MKIRCLLVDDEKPARDELRFLLSFYDDIDIIDEADSASRTCSLIRVLQPDLVFLDIQMPGSSGFDVIDSLTDLVDLPLFIFVTAYDNHAVKAFEKNALDYVLKPISTDRLNQSLERARRVIGTSEQESISKSLQNLLNQVHQREKEVVRVSVECGGRIQLLAPAEIVFCSLEENRIMVHTHKQGCPLYGISTMEKLATHLNSNSFFRIHRSALVNLDHIREFSPWVNGKYSLIMDDEAATELSVSRMRVKEFRQRLGI